MTLPEAKRTQAAALLYNYEVHKSLLAAPSKYLDFYGMLWFGVFLCMLCVPRSVTFDLLCIFVCCFMCCISVESSTFVHCCVVRCIMCWVLSKCKNGVLWSGGRCAPECATFVLCWSVGAWKPVYKYICKVFSAYIDTLSQFQLQLHCLFDFCCWVSCTDLSWVALIIL